MIKGKYTENGKKETRRTRDKTRRGGEKKDDEEKMKKTKTGKNREGTKE